MYKREGNKGENTQRRFVKNKRVKNKQIQGIDNIEKKARKRDIQSHSAADMESAAVGCCTTKLPLPCCWQVWRGSHA
jgi:hypothetical protein